MVPAYTMQKTLEKAQWHDRHMKTLKDHQRAYKLWY
jgi:hypothetical protein